MEFDIVGYLASLKMKFEYRSQKRYVYVLCPDCDGAEPHLWVHVKTGGWGCWKSSRHKGGPKKLIMHLERVSESQAGQTLRKFSKAGTYELEEEIEELKFKEITLPEGLVPAGESREAMAFLRRRGFTVQTAVDWDLYYAKNTRYKGIKFKQRIIIPIYHEGKLIAFQGRDVTGRQSIPYLSSPPEDDETQPLNHSVYNAQRVDPSLIVITEGVSDCWTIGKEHGTCLFGKRLYEEQFDILESISYNGTKIVVALDGDAYDDAEQIAMDLVGFDVRVPELPYGEDPASLGHEKIWELIRDVCKE
jgi:DNA primase